MKFLRGQASIALSLAIPMMVGVACIGADMWSLEVGSARLQQAADTAVLSGAAYLPANPALAQNVARSKAQVNGIREDEIVYNHSASDGLSITMVVERKLPYRFARLFGRSQSVVTVKAAAGANLSQSVAGLLPIGIQYSAHYTLYQPILLKLAPARGAALAGTWRPLAIGERNGYDARQNYEKNLTDGYENPIRVGDTVSVEASDQAAVTKSGLAARLYSGLRSDPGAVPTNYVADDPRRIEVPIVDFNFDGGNRGVSTGSVHGFAALWITSVDASGDINAEFLDLIVPGDTRQRDRGSLTAVLLE